MCSPAPPRIVLSCPTCTWRDQGLQQSSDQAFGGALTVIYLHSYQYISQHNHIPQKLTLNMKIEGLQQSIVGPGIWRFSDSHSTSFTSVHINAQSYSAKANSKYENWGPTAMDGPCIWRCSDCHISSFISVHITARSYSAKANSKYENWRDQGLQQSSDQAFGGADSHRTSFTTVHINAQSYSAKAHTWGRRVSGAGVHMGAGAYSCGAGAYISYSSVGQESTIRWGRSAHFLSIYI